MKTPTGATNIPVGEDTNRGDDIPIGEDTNRGDEIPIGEDTNRGDDNDSIFKHLKVFLSFLI